LGVAGGNGLERIDPAITKRVCGLDINSAYLDAVRQRYADLPGLELYCADLAQEAIEFTPVRLVHAAMIFEHAGVERCLENALSMVAPGGNLSVVLQLPSPAEDGVSVSPYPSLLTLREDFRLIDPVFLRERIESAGFRMAEETTRPLACGKAFWMGIFERR
jgi:SAM-dependent methyltransferase